MLSLLIGLLENTTEPTLKKKELQEFTYEPYERMED